MYPESKESALLDQLLTERAISDLTETALALWLPLAEAAVLQAAAPPPDASAAADESAQWDYLVDALIMYGVGIIAADAYSKAYRALAGVPLAVGEAALKALRFDMPGMPSRADLAKRAADILRVRLSIDVSTVESEMATSAPMREFVSTHTANVKRRVLDAVARVYRRVRKAEDSTPDTAAVREEIVGVFDPLDPQWRSAADEVGQTHGTGTLNAALEQAAKDSGRQLEVGWVAILDTHTRLAHREADGQRRPPGVAFDVGGEQLRFPGDPLGDLDNTINCRCRLFAYFTSPNPASAAAAARFAAQLDGQPYQYQTSEADFTGLFGDIADVLSRPHDTLAGRAEDDFNWVDDCGGLPKYIKRIAKHLEEEGMTKSHAIATAVNAVKKMCKTGDTNFPGRQVVNKMSRAEACKAAAAWEKLKECAARKRAENATAVTEFNVGVAVTDYRSFTSVLAVIGEPTDDGRMFANDIKLAFRDFPLPLMWCRQSAGGHYDAFTVGVIESAGVVGKEVIGKGYLLNTPEADEAAVQIEHGVTGPSVDLGDVEWELRDGATGQPVTEEQYWDNPDMELIQTVLSAKILAATLVATPAFGSTSIALGDSIEKGEDALVAAAAAITEDVVTPISYPAAFFADPQFSGPTLPHITPEGRIQGHLAAFNVCHIGIQDACVIAPRSQTDYAWFHTAPPVKTDDGPVKVGRLTVGGGHAGPKLGVGATVAHYDNAGTCFALVHVGEDEHGIWFSGVPAPGATAEQIEAGLSAPLSGDWRNVGGNLELVAALAVNTPGFPIIASGATDENDAPLALVASLGPCADSAAQTPTGSDGLNADQLRAFVKMVVDEQRAADRRDRLAQELIAGEVRRQAVAIIEGAN